jgi:hypothetical protein
MDTKGCVRSMKDNEMKKVWEAAVLTAMPVTENTAGGGGGGTDFGSEES